MAIQGTLLNTNPCPTGPGPCELVYRSIYGQLDNTGATGSNISGSDNMIAYLKKALNNQLTGADAANNIENVGWSETLYMAFLLSTDTTPTGGTSIGQDGGHQFSRTDFWTNGPYQIASPTNDIIVSQVWLGAARPFMILATGFQFEAQGGKNLACEGCTFTFPTFSACGSGLLINLPVPNITLGGANSDCSQYTFALVGPNTNGESTGIYPNLTAMVEDTQLNYVFGPNWNPNQTCTPSPSDPFAAQT